MKAGRTATFTGAAAEDAAARLYEAEGGRVLTRRWRCQEGEIDLVVALGPTLVFVEVKARRVLSDAAAAVSPAQSRRLAAAVARYLASHPGQAGSMRVDAVVVDRAGRTVRIENAVTFDEW